MTSVTAIAGAIPLILAGGAGAETRAVIGLVIAAGVASSTIFTIFVVPVAYALFAKNTGSPGDVARRLAEEEKLRPEDRPAHPAESPAAGNPAAAPLL
jgi:multidrug efflux pump